MLARVFVVIAAVLFVGSAAVASVGGPLMPLHEALRALDQNVVVWITDHSNDWWRRWIVSPVMIRPAWLAPASLGVVALGLAASLNSMRGTPLRRKN